LKSIGVGIVYRWWETDDRKFSCSPQERNKFLVS